MRQLVDVLFLSCVLFSDLLCVYGQNGNTGGVQDAVASLSKMHEAWGAKASTPNTSLTIKESSRSGQVIKFRLYASGVPKAGVYAIVS